MIFISNNYTDQLEPILIGVMCGVYADYLLSKHVEKCCLEVSHEDQQECILRQCVTMQSLWFIHKDRGGIFLLHFFHNSIHRNSVIDVPVSREVVHFPPYIDTVLSSDEMFSCSHCIISIANTTFSYFFSDICNTIVLLEKGP